MSSGSTDKEPDGKSYGHKTQNSKGECSDGHKIIALRSYKLLYSFDFNRNLNKVDVTEIGRHPHGNAHTCMTPYGMFSMQCCDQASDKYDCILIDISSPNNIRLPALTINPLLHPVCVNATVYVLNIDWQDS